MKLHKKFLEELVQSQPEFGFKTGLSCMFMIFLIFIILHKIRFKGYRTDSRFMMEKMTSMPFLKSNLF